MNFSEDWKGLWPISSTFSPPLLIPNKKAETLFGPLLFTPSPNVSPTHLLQSPSLSPRLPRPYPQLSSSRFIRNHAPGSSVPSLLGPQLPDFSSYFHGFNSLQLLQIPQKNVVVVFFPKGENSDRVGFCLLSIKDGILSCFSTGDNFFDEVKEGNRHYHRITLLMVNPVDDEDGGDMFGNVRGVSKHKNIVTVGFLMVCTDYSVYWYGVGIAASGKQNELSVSLEYLGCANAMMLRGSAVMSACWNSDFREECLVLLENGDLMLFDVTCSVFNGTDRIIKRVMRVSLNDKVRMKDKNGDERLQWFGCEFSWHPRIFIAAHHTRVFLVDLRCEGEFVVTCLLKLDMLMMGKNDGFLALARGNCDGFFFAVATRHLLLLCDVRKPLMPVLRWIHGLHNPRYMTIFSLSELRANAEDTKYKCASESGYCILLGSFWDKEFCLFCYGPNVNSSGSVSSYISKFCNSKYAWGLPSELSLSSSECQCGSFLVREEFLQDSLPVWIDWRQRKDLVLGFGILNSYLSMQLFSPASFGGFVLVRLTSSGKLEAQQYLAVCEAERLTRVCLKRRSVCLEDNLLYDLNNSEYEGEKKFHYMKLEVLNAYLKDQLAQCIVKIRKDRKERGEKIPKKYTVESQSNHHQEICHRLKACGLPRVRSSLSVSSVLEYISLPTSIPEIALMSSYAALPTSVLRFAFSTYSDFNEDTEKKKESLQFLDIPEQQQQLPPFPVRKPSQRSNKWSSKVQQSDNIVGPIIPPLFLYTYCKVRMEELKNAKELYLEESEGFKTNSQFLIECDKVMEIVTENVMDSESRTHGGDFVSLADDTEDSSYGVKRLKLAYHKPLSILKNPPTGGAWKPGCEDDILSTHVFRRRQELASDLSAEIIGQELFDVGCPIELKFKDFGPQKEEAYRLLKKLDIDFQRSSKHYQDYISKWMS